MRGTRGEGGSRGSPARLIPARAGNIEGGDAATEQPPAHPRSHGEHSSPKPHAIDTLGSSPLSQGTFVHVLHLIVPLRLIPAHAGNMHRAAEPRHFQPAHPRSRGEHVPVIFALERVFGSSPLARGTSAGGLMMESRARLIPARAGNIERSPRPCRAHPAHPRSRGEHSLTLLNFTPERGSSPLARGTCEYGCLRARPLRLIPARAGNIAIAEVTR